MPSLSLLCGNWRVQGFGTNISMLILSQLLNIPSWCQEFEQQTRCRTVVAISKKKVRPKMIESSIKSFCFPRLWSHLGPFHLKDFPKKKRRQNAWIKHSIYIYIFFLLVHIYIFCWYTSLFLTKHGTGRIHTICKKYEKQKPEVIFFTSIWLKFQPACSRLALLFTLNQSRHC